MSNNKSKRYGKKLKGKELQKFKDFCRTRIETTGDKEFHEAQLKKI